MSINLALILVLLTAFTGAVVAFNRFYVAKLPDQGRELGHGTLMMIEYSRSFFPVLLIVLIIRSFIFEPFRIPSGSMMPTLVQGDYIFVKKFQYGLRLPVTETKFLETGSPQRGDVVVFRLPMNPSINYIKRVVGLPGDEVVYRDRQLFINGEEMPLSPDDSVELKGLDLYVDDELVMEQIDLPGSSFTPLRETLDGREHSILLRADLPNTGREQRFTVPEGHYFMMGDNRDRSQDSRKIGVVADSYLVGEAVFIWMHVDFSDGMEWPNWGRIGTGIQ